MRHLLLALFGLFLLLISAGLCCAPERDTTWDTAAKLSPHVSVCQGIVNGVFIENDGRTLVIYGEPGKNLQKADIVLFTHFRRDVAWAALNLVENGVRRKASLSGESVVPAAEAHNFLKVADFWTSFVQSKFHDYEQRSTKILTKALRVGQKVSEGDTINWQNITLKVLDTPGYTRGSVSYFATVDGINYGFVGDLIYGDGHLMDLYSLQDAVTEARIGGYHGYAGRLGKLIKSLRKVLEQNPDILVPARGPVIRNPKASIELLIQRLQMVYENYLSINAGHWYFKDLYETLAARVLEPNNTVRCPERDALRRMPYATIIEKTPPSWIIPIYNSRLILSKDRTGFLIDCGSEAIISKVKELRDSGRLSRLEGLFITHYHDDHTDKANELVQEFKCPVYACQILKDILEHPEAYRLPAMTSSKITGLTVVPDGYKMLWKEFNLTFYDFPGQTIYHDALFVEKDGGEKIFFIGDSFTPSGIDDYCLQNRNFLNPGMGYFYCLDILQKMPPDYLLINQHVLEPFRFAEGQLKYMTAVLEKRKQLLAGLFPWDEPNYGLDEQWARLYPYSQKAKAGQHLEIAAKIFNHSSAPHLYTISLNVPEGFQLEPKRRSINITPREEAEIRFEMTVPDNVLKNLYVITADVQFDEWDLRQWCEAMIEIYP